jgi:hypothetical protein
MGNVSALSEIRVQISDTGGFLSRLKAHVLDRVSRPLANTVWVPADFSGFLAGKAANKSLEHFPQRLNRRGFRFACVSDSESTLAKEAGMDVESAFTGFT